MLSEITFLVLAGVLLLGAVLVDLVTTMSCFDGDEPGCESTSGGSWPAEIQTSSWIMAAVAAGAVIAALVTAVRARARFAPHIVVALCAVTWALSAVLWSRVWW